MCSRKWMAPAAVLLAVVCGLGGCATLINGKTQRLQFESRPSGAAVHIDGDYVGRTPVAVRLRRTRHRMVRISLPRHRDFAFALRSRTSGWGFVNLVWGLGFIGLIVDAATGSMSYLDPQERSSRGRMLLHEGSDRLYVRAYLCRVGEADPGAGDVAAGGDR